MLTLNYKLLQNVDFNIRVNGESICFIESMKNVSYIQYTVLILDWAATQLRPTGPVMYQHIVVIWYITGHCTETE